MALYMRGQTQAPGKVKKVLVTGASGFVGQHLVPRLIKEGYLVRTLVRSSNLECKDESSSVEQCEGDLSNLESLRCACKGVGFVVHLAGNAHVAGEQQINVDGMRRLLAAAVENDVTRFLFLSSSLAADAEHPHRASTPYGDSKLAAEKILMSEHFTGSIEGVVLRPVNIYGPRMKGNIAKLISMIAKGKALPLPILNTRISLISVQDVSEAVVLGLESRSASGGTYVLTDGQEYSINQIEREIYKAVNKKVPSWKPPLLLTYVLIMMASKFRILLEIFGVKSKLLEGLSMRTYKNLMNDNLFDNEMIHQELGFKPKATFFSHLPEIIREIE